MGNESAVVQSHLYGFRTRRSGEADSKGGTLSDKSERAENDIGGPAVGVGALEVRRRVDLYAELGDVVFGRNLVRDGGEDRLLDRIRASYH